LYAILDLETTGGKYNKEGITELAIYRFDGKEIVDQFSSLINPERKIQPFVVGLTGIDHEMVHRAPKFYELAKRVVEITEECTIVAHNAKFDYRMLRLEFERLGYEFKRPTLCTVELSKELIPGFPSYSLGKLVKKLGIPLMDRHRAQGDARATVDLFKLLLDKDSEKEILKQSVRVKPKKQKDSKLIQITSELPTKTGVYYMHDDNGEIIYIGKSKNIKKRINQHFTNDTHKSRTMRKEIKDVTYELTGNELLALLKENDEIKKNKPKYNRALNKDLFTHGLYSFCDESGYLNLKLQKLKDGERAITTFSSSQKGKRGLEFMLEEFELCQKLVGLHKTSGSCFNYGIEQCFGACIGEEKPGSYNQRVEQLMGKYSYAHQNLLIVDKGRTASEKSGLLIENGDFWGMGYFKLNHQIKNMESAKNFLTPMENNRDSQHIIQSHLRQNEPLQVFNFDEGLT